MNPYSETLFLIGMCFYIASVLSLFVGRKENTPMSEILVIGRKIYEQLDDYFCQLNILIFKVFVFIGSSLFLAAVLLILSSSVS